MCWFDWGCPQSAVALHIYRMGSSIPIRSRNPNKSRVKIQLLTRIGCFGLVWPPLDRSNWGAHLLGGKTYSSGLQIGRSIYAFRLSQRDLRNNAVQFEIWPCLLDRSDWFPRSVLPVCSDCRANLNYANFGCQEVVKRICFDKFYAATVSDRSCDQRFKKSKFGQLPNLPWHEF